MSNNKKLSLLFAVLALAIIVIVVVAAQKNKQNKAGNNYQTNVDNQVAGKTAVGEPTDLTNTTDKKDVTVDLKGAKAEVPGASLITVDKKVVNPTGKVTRNDVMPISATAPRAVTVDKSQLPKEAINLTIANGGFNPKSFTVKAGAPVSLALTSGDNQVHVVVFDNNALAALAWGVGNNQTKAITFNAPAKPGNYVFRCDVPGHREAGEFGTMIVK